MEYKNIFFVGIGGIGMSALARWFMAVGKQVGGYDKTPTELTDALQKEGMNIHFEDNLAKVPAHFLSPSDTLIIYTPAIPKDHSELRHFMTGGFTIMKRSEVLGLITKEYFTVAVGGTHGKTTTSSMLAYLLHEGGVPCHAFLGGIAVNFNSNLLISNAPADKTVVVVEADEYDRSFLRLFPNISIITAIEADHLDIYGTEKEVEEGYMQFVAQTDKTGQVFMANNIKPKLLKRASGMVKTTTFGTTNAQVAAKEIRIIDGEFFFNYSDGSHQINDIKLGMPGFHNIQNAIAASAVALQLGASPESIKKSLAGFKGIKRRFELIAKTERTIFYDDYAHHPTEVEAFIRSAKTLHPNRKLTVIFQPHLFTRTRDFADGFAESLSLADQVILMPIYPARELPIEGVNSEMVLGKLTCPEKHLLSEKEVLSFIAQNKPALLATVGAGNIDQLVSPIRNLLIGTSA